MKALAVNFGFDERVLDHLAPLCFGFAIPFLVTSEENFSLLKKYYPMVNAIYLPPDEVNYSALINEYDLFLQSTFWREDSLLQLLAKERKKKVQFLYVPHGNSDKGYIAPMMQQILNQELLFLYGPHMMHRLKKQSFWHSSLKYLFCGNYRYLFYKKHKAFYDPLVEKEIFHKLDKRKKNLLYAPTWNDQEESTSYYAIAEKLTPLAEQYNILFKPHPMLIEQDPARYFACLSLFQKNVFVLENFPLIYPLLNRIDIYLGDFSSIGYDFLTFQRPMFFYPPEDRRKTSCALYDCGIKMQKEDLKNLQGFFEKHLALDRSAIQKERYLYSFGKEKSFEELYNALIALRSLPKAAAK